MAHKFEEGKSYEWMESGFGLIKVIKRTKKTILVDNGSNTWRMLIRVDQTGTEYVTDSSVPELYRDVFTCYASHDEGWRSREEHIEWIE